MAQLLHHTIIKPALFRLLLLAVIWWSFTNGSISSWIIGIPAIVISTYISLKLIPASKFSITGFIRFIPFFIQHSVSGGIDVALRAIRPQLHLYPDLIEFKPHLAPGMQMFVMLCTVNLLPGTLCCELKAGILKIHVLDTGLNYFEELQAIESRVAKLFSITLENTSGL